MRPPSAILETILYGRDLPAMVAFYRDTLFLRLLKDWSELGAVFRVTPDAILIIFNPDESSAPGRTVPSHGNVGPGHIALSIDDAEYNAWLTHVQDQGIQIEQEQVWSPEGRPRGGRSIYLRDPAGNSVELITADIWPE